MGITQGVFTDDITKTMATAFDLAWQELEAVQPLFTSPFDADASRGRLGMIMVELAGEGVSDADTLKNHALEHFIGGTRPSTSCWRGRDSLRAA